MVDNLTRQQRSFCMSRIRGRDTKPERDLGCALRRQGLRFRKHESALPGRPDIVFVERRLAVFVDGEFWHGYRYPQWNHSLSGFWRKKITGNRARDQRNFRKLRRRGWCVLRIWQRQIERDVAACVERIERRLAARSCRAPDQARERRHDRRRTGVKPPRRLARGKP